MAQALGPYTIEMWERLPTDGNRYELLDGELIVTPMAQPPHQVVVGRLTTRLVAYLEAHQAGTAWPGGDVFFDKHNVLEPDLIAVVGGDPLKLKRWKDLPDPALAVEVLSPSSARYDRGRKREKHLARAAEYWIVDIESRLVEVWRPGDERPLVVRDRVAWRPRPDLPPLEIALADLFADLPD